MSFDAEVAADAPRSWWRFDDASGLAVPDFGTDGNDGELAGAIQQVGAQGHRSIRETDRAVRLPYVDQAEDEDPDAGGYMEADPALFGTPGAFTVEAVVWPDGPPGSPYALRIFTLAHDDGVDDGIALGINGTTANLGASVSNASSLGAGEFGGPGGYYEVGGDSPLCWVGWNHVAYTYAAGTMTLYHQGAPCGTAAVLAGGLVYHPSRRLLIGRQNKEFRRGRRWFDGKISEVVLYDHALSAARIEAHASTAPWCRNAGFLVGSIA